MNAFFFRQPNFFYPLSREGYTIRQKNFFYMFNPASISWKKYPERHNKF